MSYIKTDLVPVGEGEVAVMLDQAPFAISCERKRVDSGIAYHARARALERDGSPLLDANAKPIETELKHTVPHPLVLELGDENIARECMLAVMGEPVSLIPWGQPLLDSVSIKTYVATRNVAGNASSAL